jgi:formylglycine-generating enzyme required for sulfatase activity
MRVFGLVAVIRGSLAVALALAGMGAGCGGAPARAQWLVFVGTDAPIPQFGQQLLVEVLDANGQLQSPSERRFIDGSHPSAWPISFGVVPDDVGAPPRIRVRLYRLDETGSDGLPASTSLIDATATFPTASGVTRVGIVLAMACFGMGADPATAQTCVAGSRALVPEPILAPDFEPSTLPAPGSWSQGATVPCSGAAPPGMSCLPGGALLLGSPQFFPQGADTDPVPQHLVVLSPFAIDDAEVTVGQVRSLVQASSLPAPIALGGTTDSGRSEECTYLGVDVSSNDAAPANCLPWSSADLACRLLGKRLPTEAEWEYAARNQTEESAYPWGSDPAACDYAVVARGVGVFADATECEPLDGAVSPGPVAGGSPLDLTGLGVLNLGGNLAEWTADYFAPYSGGCWSGGDPLVNPSCQTPALEHSVRGGSWQSPVEQAASVARSAPSSDDASEAIGFRCAMSM